MSDRCYMQVTCRRQDRQRFEALGFHPEFTDTPTDGHVVELIDAGADYGHANRLPTDVPFLASHDTGGNFGARRIACDGRRTAEVPATSDGFIVEWDASKRRPTTASLARIRRYFAVQQRAQRRMAAQPRPHQTRSDILGGNATGGTGAERPPTPIDAQEGSQTSPRD